MHTLYHGLKVFYEYNIVLLELQSTLQLLHISCCEVPEVVQDGNFLLVSVTRMGSTVKHKNQRMITIIWTTYKKVLRW